MSVLVVVVIVGVIAAIAVATLSDDPKPATPDRPAEREPVRADDAPGAFEPAFPLRAPEPAFAQPPPEPRAERTLHEPEPEPEVDVEVDELAPSIPDDRGWARRLRSAGLLGLAVAALGAVAAATIGGSLLIGYRFLDRALG